MTIDDLDSAPGTLETDRYVVRTMHTEDLKAVVEIDRAATGRRRTEYFTRMLERALDSGGVQISLVAETGDQVVGVVVGTVFYGSRMAAAARRRGADAAAQDEPRRPRGGDPAERSVVG